MLLVALLVTPLVAAILSWLARKRPAMEAVNLTGFAVSFVIALLLGAQDGQERRGGLSIHYLKNALRFADGRRSRVSGAHR